MFSIAKMEANSNQSPLSSEAQQAIAAFKVIEYIRSINPVEKKYPIFNFK
jgi:hypothetical protein